MNTKKEAEKEISYMVRHNSRLSAHEREINTCMAMCVNVEAKQVIATEMTLDNVARLNALYDQLDDVIERANRLLTSIEGTK